MTFSPLQLHPVQKILPRVQVKNASTIEGGSECRDYHMGPSTCDVLNESWFESPT